MKTIRNYILLPVMLSLFDGELNPNLTTSDGMSAEMKIFYSDYLIDLAEPELVHDQFGQKHPIPKNGGKVIEFRQYDPLPEQTTPLVEGVTPDGQSLTVKTITSEVKQYGGYVTFNLRISTSFGDKDQFTVYGSVENILDKSYQTNEIIHEPGRFFTLGVSGKF